MTKLDKYMANLHQRSELAFAMLWIVLYLFLTSLGNLLSDLLGVAGCGTAILHLAMSLILARWIRKSGMVVRYGLRWPHVPAAKLLFYLPLTIVASSSLWRGVQLSYSPAETLLFAVSMCCVGFLEEMLFRGFLFRALEKNGLKSAMLLSSLAFGAAHIVNLLGSSGQPFAETLFQIFFAILTGLVLVLIFHISGSLIPCIAFHSLNNVLSIFSTSESVNSPGSTLTFLTLILLMGGYLLYAMALLTKTDGMH